MEPWKVSTPSSGKYRFTNSSGERAVGIVLQPVGNIEIRSTDPDPQTVPNPVAAGASFDRVVKRLGVEGNAGVRINWISPESGQARSWVYRLAE